MRCSPRRVTQTAAAVSAFVLVTGCATQAPPIASIEAPQTISQQQQAQLIVVQAPAARPALKRKIAIGRVSNETAYGRSLLRDNAGDPVGKQVSDMLVKALTESGAFVVLERSDLTKLKDEAQLTGSKQDFVGVDALIMGSLTEFGRKAVGQAGFVSNSKKQLAFAKIDLRLVDVKTGQSFFAASGAGESSTESATTFGFGSQAGYDATLNDASIRQAVSEVVNRLSSELLRRPWQTSLIGSEQGSFFIAGGKSQGILPGMVFSVQTVGKKVKSPQSGFEITLPGKEIAQLRIDALFGDTEVSEGASASLVSGTLQGLSFDQLTVREKASQ